MMNGEMTWRLQDMGVTGDMDAPARVAAIMKAAASSRECPEGRWDDAVDMLAAFAAGSPQHPVYAEALAVAVANAHAAHAPTPDGLHGPDDRVDQDHSEECGGWHVEASNGGVRRCMACNPEGSGPAPEAPPWHEGPGRSTAP